MDKGLYPPFPQEEWPRNSQELPGYNPYIYRDQDLQCSTAQAKIAKILKKNQNGFRLNRSTTSQVLTIRRILYAVFTKNLAATILSFDLSKAFCSIYRGKMEQVLLAYGLLKETVVAITMLYKNTKGDKDYFYIVAGVLEGDKLNSYQFIICREYVFTTSIDSMKKYGFKLAKERSRRYPAQTITDVDYADDIALLANLPTQAESLLHSLGRAVGGICLHVKVDKTEHMRFNQRSDIFTIKGDPLKLEDKFTYLGSSVSSTEYDNKMWFAKVWTTINRLSVISKSDLTDKIKRSFFPCSGSINTTIWMHHMDTNKAYGEKAWRQLHKNAASNIEQVLEATPHKTTAVRPPATNKK